VLSCAAGARERRALDDLLAALRFEPWRVVRGDIDVAGLFELIAGADLHLSGDTGSMHLAWLAGTASVSWMSSLGNVRAWAPVGPRHRVVCSGAPSGRFLAGIATDEVVAASVELVRGGPRAERAPQELTRERAGAAHDEGLPPR
jgi:ADP-heptose:LPS heptosyltransferase